MKPRLLTKFKGSAGIELKREQWFRAMRAFEELWDGSALCGKEFSQSVDLLQAAIRQNQGPVENALGLRSRVHQGGHYRADDLTTYANKHERVTVRIIGGNGSTRIRVG